MGGVQGLDGGAHQHGKQMFMSLVTTGRIEQLVQLTAAEWHIRLRSWEATDEVVLYPDLHCF